MVYPSHRVGAIARRQSGRLSLATAISLAPRETFAIFGSSPKRDNPELPNLRHLIVHFLSLLGLLLLSGCEQKPLFDRIKTKGELVVVTRELPASYFHGQRGIEGLEYELVRRFAGQHGLRVRFVIADTARELLWTVRAGAAHIGAAHLAVTPYRKRGLRFSDSYDETTQEVVYRMGNKRPRNLEQLEDTSLIVPKGSRHEALLRELQTSQVEHLSWKASERYNEEELLALLNEGVIESTLADADLIDQVEGYYPRVLPAFAVGEDFPVAWALGATADDSLLQAVNAFIAEIKVDGTLEQLIDRYYDNRQHLDFVERRDFIQHLETRLPTLEQTFREVGGALGIDWRLLAAMGYQESHWKTNAVSPTGVRGIMMLTLDTAEQMGVEDRTAARESILGGARYLKGIMRKIPARIPRPDSTWLALAAYNIGFGHLEDARVLTQRQGGNPDHWIDVKKRLPLLAKKEYHSTLKHGFARGGQPVHYVKRIQYYYDTLIWFTNRRDRAGAKLAARKEMLPLDDSANQAMETTTSTDVVGPGQ